MQKINLNTVAFALLFNLYLVLLTAPDATCKNAPSFPYTDCQIFHLHEGRQSLYYGIDKYVQPVDENLGILEDGHVSFDKNGNLLSYNFRRKAEKYKYSKRGFKVYTAKGVKLARWRVVCDTVNRTRKDIYQEKYPRNRCYTYTFDASGRHKSTLYTENDWKVIVIYHYPDEPPFRPGKSWKARDYGRVNGSRSSIWYQRVNKDGLWLEEQHTGVDTSYYTAHCVLGGVQDGGEGLIFLERLRDLRAYRNEHNWERSYLKREVAAGKTEFEKAIASLGVFCPDGRLMAERDANNTTGWKVNPYKTKASGKRSWVALKSGAEQMINQRFLFRYIDIPLKVQNIICNILCVLLCLAAFYYATALFSKEAPDFTYKSAGDVAGGRFLILLLSLFELAVFYICPDAKGFLFKINGIWALIPLAALLILFVGQVGSTMRLLELGNLFSGREAPIGFLQLGFLFYMIALIVSLFAENLRPYAIMIGFGAIALQILIDLIATIVNKTSFFSLIRNALWMIVACSAIMLLAYAFAVIFVIVFLGYAFLSGLAHSGEATCSNCRTYCDGFCYYRNSSVVGGDHCSKHQW